MLTMSVREREGGSGLCRLFVDVDKQRGRTAQREESTPHHMRIPLLFVLKGKTTSDGRAESSKEKKDHFPSVIRELQNELFSLAL